MLFSSLDSDNFELFGKVFCEEIDFKFVFLFYLD